MKLKELNYKVGAIKRKLNIKRSEKVEPGDLIKKAKRLSKEKVAIMGLV